MDDEFDVEAMLGLMEVTRELPEEVRREVASVCRLEILPARTRLLAAEHAAEHVFLVDGHAVRLINGAKDEIESHQGLNEPLPLFDDPDPEAVAVTLTPCNLLWVPVASLETVLPPPVEVHDVELDATEGALLEELYELISSRRLELPTRPEVALKIQELTADPESGLNQLTEVIQRDATLAGGLLHAVNSPLFRAAEPIQSVREAVLRLGYRNTRMLTTNLALRHAFKARHEHTRHAMRRTWSNGVLCSAFSYLIADTLGILDRERALLAGLIAGIGAVPIIQFVELRAPHSSQAEIENLVDKLQGITGALVVNYWGVGPDLVAVAENFGNWGYEAREPDYASVVTAAHWCALGEQNRPQPAVESVSAFRVLGIDSPTQGEGLPLLAERGKDLKSLQSLFAD